MATNSPSSFIAPARLRGLVRRARQFVLAQSPLVRILCAATLVGGIASLAYFTGQPYYGETSKKYLGAGRAFSKDELLRICRALDAGRVNYTVDRQRRVDVSHDQYEIAAGIISKLELGPRSIEEIRKEALTSSFLDSDSDRQRRDKLARVKLLETLIDRLDGVASSYVAITEPRPTTGLRRASNVTAFVQVETDDEAELPFKTVEAIRNIIVRNVADLSPGGLTIMDGESRLYSEPNNETLATSTRDRVQSEQLRQEILEQLDWIRGVRVSVRIDPTPQPVPTTPAPGPTATHEQSPQVEGTSDSPRVRPQVALNAPLDVDDDSIAEPPAARPAAPVKQTTPAPSIPKVDLARKGRINVEIPRSFYYFNYMAAAPSEKQPSREEILRSMEPIETKVRQSVKMMIPGPEDGWEIHVGSIPDDVPLARANPSPRVPETRRQAIGWEAIGAIAAVLVVLVASIMFRVGRRPEIRVAASGSRRVHRDSRSDPAPSERVRELVRRNPQAAASVLQRWVGQGGDA